MDPTQRESDDTKPDDKGNAVRLPLEESINEADKNTDTFVTQSISFSSLLQQYAKRSEASSSKSVLTQEDFHSQYSHTLSFVCPVCSLGIGTREELKIHIINAHNSSSECAENILIALDIEASKQQEKTKQDIPEDVLSTCQTTSETHSRASMNRSDTFISSAYPTNEAVSSQEMFENTNIASTAQLSGCSSGTAFTRSSNENLQTLVKPNSDTQGQNRFTTGINNKDISSQISQPVSVINKVCKKCGKIFNSILSCLQHEMDDNACGSMKTPSTQSNSPKAPVHKNSPPLINKPGQSNFTNMPISMHNPLPINMAMMPPLLNTYNPYVPNPTTNPLPFWPVQNLTYPYWPNPNMNNYRPPTPVNRPARQRRRKAVNDNSPSQHSLSVTTPNPHNVMDQDVSQLNKRAKEIPEGYNQNTSAHTNKKIISDESLKTSMNKDSDQERRNQNQHSRANSDNFPNPITTTGSEEDIKQLIGRHSISDESPPRNLYLFDTLKFETEYRKIINKGIYKEEVNKPFTNTVPPCMSQTFTTSDTESSRASGASSENFTLSPNPQMQSQFPVTDSTPSSRNTNNNQFASFDCDSLPAVNLKKSADNYVGEFFYGDNKGALSKLNALSKNFVHRLLKKDYQKGQRTFEERDDTMDDNASMETLRQGLFKCKSCPEVFGAYTQLIRHRQFSCLDTYNNVEAISDGEESPEVSKLETPQPSVIVIPKGTGIEAFSNNMEELYNCDKCNQTFYGNKLWAEHQKSHTINPFEALHS